MCLYVPRFQRQVFKHVKIFSERSKKMKEHKKNKRSVLVAETAYNSQNAKFSLVRIFEVYVGNFLCYCPVTGCPCFFSSILMISVDFFRLSEHIWWFENKKKRIISFKNHNNSWWFRCKSFKLKKFDGWSLGLSFSKLWTG